MLIFSQDKMDARITLAHREAKGNIRLEASKPMRDYLASIGDFRNPIASSGSDRTCINIIENDIAGTETQIQRPGDVLYCEVLKYTDLFNVVNDPDFDLVVDLATKTITEYVKDRDYALMHGNYSLRSPTLGTLHIAQAIAAHVHSYMVGYLFNMNCVKDLWSAFRTVISDAIEFEHKNSDVFPHGAWANIPGDRGISFTTVSRSGTLRYTNISHMSAIMCLLHDKRFGKYTVKEDGSADVYVNSQEMHILGHLAIETVAQRLIVNGVPCV